MTSTSRRSFWNKVGRGALALACAATFFCAREAPPEPEKPLNFVFLLIDDLGWTDVASYGSRLYETPNVDRLAAEGMKFTDAYAAAPVCSPTRASVMSGKYPPRVNVTGIVPGQAEGLALEEVTIAERLKQAGYVSASVGKWHLGRENLYPEKQGFDVNVGGTHIGMVTDFFYPDWRDSRNLTGARGGVPVEGEPGEYLPDRLSLEAARFIETNKDNPFFLYLTHYTVHTPMQAKEDLLAKYEAKVDPEEPQNNPIYAAMIESMDDSVGRVLDKLDELNLADNTVVIFTSDNGGLATWDDENTPATSNVPLRLGKGFMYEGGIRVPLIVRWPGAVQPGSVSAEPVISTDFLPTILDMAGLQLDPQNPVDGVSMVPILKQTGPLDRDAIYWHYPHYDITDSDPSGAIRAGDYKLIEFFPDGGRLELYNLAEDIGETKNLATEMPDKTKELHQKLLDWRESVGAKLPEPKN